MKSKGNRCLNKEEFKRSMREAILKQRAKQDALESLETEEEGKPMSVKAEGIKPTQGKKRGRKPKAIVPTKIIDQAKVGSDRPADISPEKSEKTKLKDEALGVSMALLDKEILNLKRQEEEIRNQIIKYEIYRDILKNPG